ncbi:MAG: TIR domain-containing protein [Actinobacteria bacterium]|nr:TIR domain-containing protein [Actinomycetota bacterium]
MPREKIVFIAFAKEDEAIRNLFRGQKLHPRTPFKFTDMSVKQAYDTGWKAKTRTRIRRSDGVIVLVSSHTRQAKGQLWEIACAKAEGKPIRGFWIEDGYRTKPRALGATVCLNWTWSNVATFIDSL